jgi:hypothetical protein
MEKPTRCYFSWIVSFQNQIYICETLPLEINNPEVNYSPIRISGFLYSRNIQQQALKEEGLQREKKEQHNYKIGTWNVRTLNRGGKLNNLKREMQ